MMRSQSFLSIHRQGFVRVAGCTPRVHVGDPKANADETLALMRDGESRHVALAIFPELGISAYAIDDLLLQDALLNGVEDGLRRLVEASRDMRMISVVGAPVRRNQRLYNCAVVIARGKILGVVPKSFLPNYREYYENRWFAPGVGEGTTDRAWDGQPRIHELGALLAYSERFPKQSQMAVADVDVERIRLERMRTLTFNAAAAAAGHPEKRFRKIAFEHQPDFADVGLERKVDRFPFVPDDPKRLDLDCYEAFNIQVQGLMKRLQSTNGERIVIGVSGGLDSTHALLVAAKAFDELGLPRKNILGFTLPGFATSEGTKSNA